jgi:ribose transport system ATP-binding protein
MPDAGRTELGEAIAGLRKRTSGEVTINDKPARIGSPPDAVRAGIADLSEDRKAAGLT